MIAEDNGDKWRSPRDTGDFSSDKYDYIYVDCPVKDAPDTGMHVPVHATKTLEYYVSSLFKLGSKKPKVIMLDEFTRSRPRRSNDNGLVETKNGAVVRKLFGYEHIAQPHAVRMNTFCTEYLNPFLNFHRPCLFATELPDPKKPGRIKRVYRARDAMTPLDKLASLPDAAPFLKEGITLDALQELARALTDVQAAEELNAARQALFRRVLIRTG